jgi:hypothetical protein
MACANGCLTCKQGRLCDARLHRLNTLNGGERVDFTGSIPPLEDEPMTTPEKAETACFFLVVILSVLLPAALLWLAHSI